MDGRDGTWTVEEGQEKIKKALRPLEDEAQAPRYHLYSPPVGGALIPGPASGPCDNGQSRAVLLLGGLLPISSANIPGDLQQAHTAEASSR